jgi:MoaA/NifB/PqqE/SkfB family radical SAM enzyme
MKYKLDLTKNFLISKIKKSPYKLNFSVTENCNSKCVTCNIWKSKDHRNELTISEIKKIFKNFPSTLCWLSLTGGEPFLRNDLYSIVSSACNELPNLRLISIPSNGLDQKRIILNIKKMLDLKINIYITFSLDGPPEIHNRIRGIENGYKKTEDTYIKVKELTKNHSNFKIGLETTISDENVDYLIPFIKKLRNHELIITIASNAYAYKNMEDKKLLSYCNIEKIKKIIAVASKQYNLTSFEDIIKRVYLKKIPLYLKNPLKLIPCAALKNSVTINSCGKVMPCYPMLGFVIGDLRKCDYNIMNFWHSKKTYSIRKMIKEKKCLNCWTPCEAYQSIIYNMI